MGDLRRRLAELVAIDSVSSRPNRPIVEHLAREATALGLQTRLYPFLDDNGVEQLNLVAATRFEAPPALALVGHTDTVPYDPAWAGALRLTEADGKLYGRGACDTKGFLACALEAASRLDLQKLRQPLALVFTGDEEVGCLGAKRLAEAHVLFPRHAIVGEPTGLVPVRAHKGYCLARVELIGREAHSAYPALGASAIFAAGHLLARIDDLARSLQAERHPGFDPPYTTLNVGVVEGGKASNIIAGSCRFTLEWRPVPGEAPSRVLDAVRGLAREVSLARGVGGSVKPIRMDKGLETATSSEIVQFLEQASGQASRTASYATEGPQLTDMRAQAAVFGPGDIGVAHATGEYVPVGDLTRCAEVLTRAIEHFCG